MMGEAEREQRVVVLNRAPPRRLAPGARFRSLKTLADRAVWEQAMAQVTALVDDGWRLERVEVDWGKTLPLASHDALDQWIRSMTGCDTVSWTWSGVGRGEAKVYLMRARNG